MAKSETRSSVLQWFLILVGGVGLGWLLYSSRDVLADTWDLIKEVDWRILLLMPLAQVASYLMIANYYRSFLRAFKHRLPVNHALGTVFALQFVNQILPSGGLSGLTYLAYSLRNIAPLGTVTLSQLTRYIFSYLSYGFVLLAAAVFLLLDGTDVPTRAVVVAVALVAASIVLGAVFWLLINDRKRINAFVHSIARLLNWMAKQFRRGSGKPLLAADKIRASLEEFHDGIRRVRRRRELAARPFGFMLMSTFFEVSIVLLAFAAIGQSVNPGIILIGFAAANAAGVISVVPGDVGVHELTMVFVLSSVGVDGAVALSATLLYRVFNKMVILPIGFFFYSKLLKPVRQQIEE